MNIIDIIKAIDGGIAVACLLFVGWRAELQFSKVLEGQNRLIETLIKLCADNDKE